MRVGSEASYSSGRHRLSLNLNDSFGVPKPADLPFFAERLLPAQPCRPSRLPRRTGIRRERTSGLGDRLMLLMQIAGLARISLERTHWTTCGMRHVRRTELN